MFIGKALCGWPGLSPDGVLSPRPMPGPCSLTARASSLGRGPTNARVGGQASKAGQKCCQIPKHSTSDPGRGLQASQPPCSYHLSESTFAKLSCHGRTPAPSLSKHRGLLLGKDLGFDIDCGRGGGSPSQEPGFKSGCQTDVP